MSIKEVILVSTTESIISSQAPEYVQLSQMERHKILVEWNQTQRDYPRDKSVHQLFEEQVRRTPDAIAVEFAEQSLTYNQLNRLSNQLSEYLRQQGVSIETRVGICVERSFDMIIGLLAILKAGGAYVPLDPRYPDERLSFLVADTGISLILTQTQFESRWQSFDLQLFVLDCDHPAWSGEPIENLCCEVPSESLAYVIYTSGSTDVPKGVEVLHRGIVRLLFGIDYVELDHTQSVLQLAVLSFDASTFEIWGPLLHGGRCVLAPPQFPDAEELHGLLRRKNVRTLWLTSTVFNTLVDTHIAALDGLEQLLVGGESLSVDHIRRAMHALGPRTRLINGYGPTECTTFACCYRLPTDIPPEWTSIPIGRPISNTTAYVLDKQGNPVPIGVTGELYLGGDGVARGYLNHPELTAEKFLPNPFSDQPDGRMYRTGDMVRWRPDGTIEFLGRVDQQIKLRGFRIELGEIETVLRCHSQIQQAVVTVREDRPGDKRLVAYFVPRNGESKATATELRQFLRAKLPEYMVPSAYIVLDAIPLTPNGKLDRDSLPVPVFHRDINEHAYVAPRTPVEEMLTDIWQAILGIEPIGIHDNFFELGGNSLLAMRIASKVKTLLGETILVRWIFSDPTIAELSRQLETTIGQMSDARPIQTVQRQDPLAVSFGQQALWLVQMMTPDPATYNQPFAFRLSGPIEHARLCRSLKFILQRHEVLRTALVQNGETLVQRIFDFADLPLPWREISLRTQPPVERDAVLQSLLVKEAREPFDLARAPLWRGLWIDLDDDDAILIFTFHHSIIDEWSMRLFLDELAALYAADGQLEQARLPELPVQFVDYVCWQRERCTGERREREIAYWRAQLANLPSPFELPVDRMRPLKPSGRGAIHESRLAGAVIPRLRKFAREESISLFSVMLASFQIWLYRYTDQADLIVGTPLADRECPEIQSSIGYFLNTLPIRARLDSSIEFRQVLQQLKQTLREAFSHASLPFKEMVELVVTERQHGRQPIYQVMFVLLEETIRNLEFGNAKGVPHFVHTETCKNDLTLDILASGDEWICRWEYDTDLFDAGTIARMADHFIELIHSIVQDPHQPIGYLDLMGQQERQTILVEWNRTQHDYPRDQSVHQLFEEQVRRTPDAVALRFMNLQVTYAELNSRANKLARHLKQIGVKNETPVGVSVERSFDLVVGMLAIFKSGGTYVPLDPEYPRDRLLFMVADTSTSIVLTQQHLESRWYGAIEKSLLIDHPNPEWTGQPDGDLDGGPPADSLAYQIYTSGSTGIPKAVSIEHRSLTNLMSWIQATHPLSADDRVLSRISINFDPSILEIWLPLMAGAQLCIADEKIVRDPRGLLNWMNSTRVTVAVFIPALLSTVIDEVSSRPSHLRLLLCGGEQLPKSLASKVAERWNMQVVNLYGPTETTILVTRYAFRNDATENVILPIGKPIWNTQLYVLDRQLQPVPIGVPGELFAGGDCVARGYLNRPEFTAEKFLHNPFLNETGTRIYRTGDLVRWRSDGTVEFLGRVDQQIKLRGFRIELSEIETVLRCHSQVQQAVATVREDRPGDKRLVAYVVPRNEELKTTATDLRQFLRAKLPDYMVPSAYVVLDAIPLTPNGKLDRDSLPVPEFHRDIDERACVAPRTPVEEMLTDVWRTILGIERIAVHDNFFELGGNSLLAIQVVDSINLRSGSTLKVGVLFSYPTVAELAQNLVDAAMAGELLVRQIYLESLRVGRRHTHLVIVGATVRAPLEDLPVGIPVWWLKLDGLHVLPHLDLDIPTQATSHVKELMAAIPSGKILLCGHSYSGLLAVEIAHQLSRFAEYRVELVLLEPSPAWPLHESFRTRLARHARALLNPNRLLHIQHLFKTLYRKSTSHIQGLTMRRKVKSAIHGEGDNRWRSMLPYFARQIRAYHLHDPLVIDLHVIGRPEYLDSFIENWKRQTSGTVITHPVPEHFSHLDLAKPEQNRLWVQVVWQIVDED